MATLTFLTQHRPDPSFRYTGDVATRVPSQETQGDVMIDAYVTHMTRLHRSPGTIRLRLFYLRKFRTRMGGELRRATHDDIDEYVHSNPAWSENTQQTITSTLKSFYRWAWMEGLIEQNPGRDVPDIRIHRRRQRIASEPAIRHALECDSLTDRAMVMLGAECGLRVTEIATLSKDRRDGEWLNIIGKGNRQRSVWLSPELAQILDRIERTTMRHGHYFPGRFWGKPIHTSTAWKHITDVLHANPHSLRRRAGTIVYRNSGHDIRLAQHFLGHSQSATTELYLDIGDDDLIKASALTRLAA